MADGTEIRPCAWVSFAEETGCKIRFPIDHFLFQPVDRCNPIQSNPPLVVSKTYDGKVLSLSCELGYVLKMKFTSKGSGFGGSSNDYDSNSSSSSLTPSKLTVSHQAIPPYDKVQVYCTGSGWKLDGDTDLDTLPECAGERFQETLTENLF